jgi:hypothetical protein
MSKSTLYSLLADGVLVVHFGFVTFVVGGLVAVGLGGLLRWGWVRNFWFRLAHLLAMGVVLAETVGGVICPLTDWEDDLRRLAMQDSRYQTSFVGYWLHRLLYYDASPTVFFVVYSAFFALVAASLWLVKPRWPSRKRVQPSSPPSEPGPAL